jgi:prepilin-type N-terminal cleavage/methylation domain-containing protein
MKNSNKGFTLIELLVVIAIIGILSSVVLASLTSARIKGQDAAIKSQMSHMRSQAELYYSVNGSNYGAKLLTTNCSTATSTNIFGSALPGSLKNLLAGVLSNTTSVNTLCAVGNTSETNGSSWGVAVTSASEPTKVTCIDSTGVSKTAVGTLSTSLLAQTSTSTWCAL